MREKFHIDIKFTVFGRPVSQKNSKRVGFKKGGKGFLWTPQNIKEWKSRAVEQISQQWGGQDPIPSGVEMEAEIISFLGKGQSIDSDNLASGPLDAMQQAGVYKNDYWVKRITSDRMKDHENPRVTIHLKNYEEKHQES